MKNWKRQIAAALTACLMLGASAADVCIAQAADRQQNMWRSNAAEVLADHYGLDDKEAAVLTSGAVKTGAEYEIALPYANGAEDRTDLVAVDYKTKTVYAKSYETDGYTWNPSEAVIYAEGEEQERIHLTAGTAAYDKENYSASGTFTYEGHDYTASVTYELYLTIDTQEQERILQIPGLVSSPVKNLEKNLKGMRLNVRDLGEAMPYVYQLLSTKVPADTTGITGSTAGTVAATESAFDPRDNADEIMAIRRLYNKTKATGEFPLYTLSQSYVDCGLERLAYAMEHGQEVIDAADGMIDDLITLRDSARLKTVVNKLKTSDPDLYEKLRYVNNLLKQLAGTTSRPGPVAAVADSDSWKILDPAVQQQVLADEPDTSSMSKLEAAAYYLKNSTVEAPQVDSETILAATAEVSEHVVLYDVTVTVSAQTTTGQTGDDSLVDQTPGTFTVILPAGLTAEEVSAALTETGREEAIVAGWNRLDDSYHINTASYARKETTLKGTLQRDITDYTIRYTPNTYKVKTNFTGTLTVPYGYRLEFPKNEDSDTDYDYVVETSDGLRTTYAQGILYQVGDNVTITRTTGTKKNDYRLYDFLADDSRYRLSEAAQEILKNTAVKSPTLKIRMPEEDATGEVTRTSTGYELKAQDSSSGVSGMTWTPDKVIVMNGDEVAAEVPFENGTASWEKMTYTHVLVRYQMKITKVKNGLFYRDLSEEDVLAALNLPDDLVKVTCYQKELFAGDGDNSAKGIYRQMSGFSDLMSQKMLNMLKEAMDTTEAQNAVIRLMTDSTQTATGVSGEKLGSGGFHSSADKLELFYELEQCEETGWSLADSYKNGTWKSLAEQMKLTADCLQVIIDDSGFQGSIQGSTGLKKQEEIVRRAIPVLYSLSETLAGPDSRIDQSNPAFEVLINDLLAAEGQTRSYTSSDGILAINAPRKTSEDSGVLTVTVQVGSKKKASKDMTYTLDARDSSGSSHACTAEDLEAIDSLISELELKLGLTEEEKNYYRLSESLRPEVGQVLGSSEAVNLVYTPNTYTVTIKGDSKYKDTFKYGGSYVISLPAKTKDTSASTCYQYTINNTKKTVNNGPDGKYTFKKADLTTLFVGGNYEITREEVKASTSTTKDEEKKDTSSDTTKKTTTDTTKAKTNKAATAAADTSKTDTGKADTTAADASAAENDTEDTSEEQKNLTATDESLEEETAEDQTDKGVPLKANIPWWLVPLLVLLLILLLALIAWYLWKKKHKEPTYDAEGAPLVDYHIEDDDAEPSSEGDTSGQE